ncbi:ferredoxin [Alteromonas gracilis]
MRIVLDALACEANGLCEAIAPDHFELDDDDRLLVRRTTVAGPEAADVERAVASCPRAALRLEADGS